MAVVVPTTKGEKCFCANEDKCPTIGEDGEGVGQRPNKVCVCVYVYIYVLCLLSLLG